MKRVLAVGAIRSAEVAGVKVRRARIRAVGANAQVEEREIIAHGWPLDLTRFGNAFYRQENRP